MERLKPLDWCLAELRQRKVNADVFVFAAQDPDSGRDRIELHAVDCDDSSIRDVETQIIRIVMALFRFDATVNAMAFAHDAESAMELRRRLPATFKMHKAASSVSHAWVHPGSMAVHANPIGIATTVSEYAVRVWADAA